MDFLQAIILSIVEGVTEFLPISSTGHLVLVTDFLNIPQTEFVKSFEIIIQLGAILAIVALYWKTLIQDIKVWKNILIAFLPTAVVGFTLYKVIKGFLIGNTTITLVALFLGGIFLIVWEFLHREKEGAKISIDQLSLRESFLIGVCQSFSIVPGVSRAAASIIGGLLVGANRKTAVEFSFLLAVPTMFGATGLDLLESNLAFSAQEFSILAVGFIGSFIVALLVVKWFIKYVQTNNFIAFGVYRIVLSMVFWWFFVR